MQANNLTRPLAIIYYWVPILGVYWSLAQDTQMRNIVQLGVILHTSALWWPGLHDNEIDD